MDESNNVTLIMTILDLYIYFKQVKLTMKNIASQNNLALKVSQFQNVFWVS